MNRYLEVSIVSIGVAAFLAGCGSHNEHLSKGKELIKSDKRRKEERAVAQFKLAIQQESSNAEAHYLLGFYDSQDFYNTKSSIENWENHWDKASVENRGQHMFLAYQQDKSKYLEILVFETLRRDEPGIQNAARVALEHVYNQERDRKKLLKSLKKAIESKDNRDRHDAHWVLAAIGKKNHDTIVPLLIDLLDHKRKGTRLNCVKALGEIRDEKAIPELVRIVDSGSAKRIRDREDPEVRQLAVEALGKIGGSAVQELVKIAQNKGSSLRVDAIQTLAKLGDERAVNPLLDALSEQGGREIEVKF